MKKNIKERHRGMQIEIQGMEKGKASEQQRRELLAQMRGEDRRKDFFVNILKIGNLGYIRSQWLFLSASLVTSFFCFHFFIYLNTIARLEVHFIKA